MFRGLYSARNRPHKATPPTRWHPDKHPNKKAIIPSISPPPNTHKNNYYSTLLFVLLLLLLLLLWQMDTQISPASMFFDSIFQQTGMWLPSSPRMFVVVTNFILLLVSIVIMHAFYDPFTLHSFRVLLLLNVGRFYICLVFYIHAEVCGVSVEQHLALEC